MGFGSARIGEIQLAELAMGNQVSRRTRLWAGDVDATFRDAPNRPAHCVRKTLRIRDHELLTFFDFHTYLHSEGFCRWAMGVDLTIDQIDAVLNERSKIDRESFAACTFVLR